MTTPTGSPDWNVPINVKAKALANEAFSLGAGTVTIGPYDVTGYTGVIVEGLAITNDTSVGFAQFAFTDPVNPASTLPTYVLNWRGDLPYKLNVPVMGPQLSVTYVGEASANQARVSLYAHMGGGSAAFGRNATILSPVIAGNLAAGNSITTELSPIREGPAILVIQKAAQDMRAIVEATDHLGNVFTVADTDTTAGRPRTIPFWLPPYPCDVKVINIGTALDAYNAVVILGRD